MNLISRLLRKNTSPARIAGFVLSNFIGLAIIVAGLQFYQDARGLWNDDSFMNTDFLVVNKKVTGAGTWDSAASEFSAEEIADVERQPWVRKVGRFTPTDYRVWASVAQGGKNMSTMMFFESIPSGFIDVDSNEFYYKPGSDEVPVIIPKDYLALYNFGFAGSAGLPQMSENLIGGIPLKLVLSSDDGRRIRELKGHIAGFSNRLNTILVPQEFMEETNHELGSGRQVGTSRLVIDVSSPGDVAIGDYLSDHDYEVAGDKSGSSASYLLNVVTGIILSVGVVITLLSFFILLLSMSLLMEKNRDKIHSLLMLGCPAGEVAKPYIGIVVWASVAACVLAVICGFVLRTAYISALQGLGAETGGWWIGSASGMVITVMLMVFNVAAVRRKVRKAWR